MAGWTRAVALAGAASVLCVLPVVASAQGKQAWEEYDRLIESKRAVAALSADNVFGDSLDLYSGVLSFTATDVSIPGNSKLPVAVTRKFTVTNRFDYGGPPGYAFGDWELDIPHISGVFAPTWHDNRCDTPKPPLAAGLVPADEFWTGNYADMPGGGEMLQVTTDTPWPKPSTGGPYKWLTAGNTYFSCLTGIENGTGQGFLAITSDGTKYWFNRMARYPEPEYVYNGTNYTPVYEPYTVTVGRNKVALYATRVEDRFGNWVEYNYTNTASQPMQIDTITSSDLRTISFDYTGGVVTSVSDGSHTWEYAYLNGSLTTVTLPDESKWQLSFGGLASAQIQHSSGDPRTCFSLDTVISGNYTGTITHPSGAIGTYTVGPVRFGRTHVPAVCRNYSGHIPNATDPNGKNDDYLVAPVRAWSLALKSRQLSGPGLTAGTWTYAWSGGFGSWRYPTGETHPICTQLECLDPWCVDDNCAGARSLTITEPDGSWTKHVYGNSYRYNEGKLLSVETGKGSNALRTVFNDYNYWTPNAPTQPYSARIGVSPQPRGAGFVSEYPRPRVWTATLQDGADFIWEVEKGCTTAGIYCFDEFAQPTKVTRTGTVAKTMPGATLVVPPGTAPALTAPATSANGSFTVSWTAVSGAATYELQEQKNRGGWATLQNTSATSRSLSGKTDGSWSYQVRACNSAGCSAWSAIKTTEVAIPPSGVPTLTAPATNTSGSYTVSWTAVSLATRYELDERKNGGSWVNIVDAGVLTWAASAKGTGTYDYRVRACNGAGCAAYSAIATTTVSSPLAAPTLAAPTTAQTYEPFTVSWTSVPTATSYVLQQNRNSTGWGDVYTGAGTSTSRTVNIAGSYQYRVQACNGNGCSPYSAIKTVQVQGDTSLLAPEEPPPEQSAVLGEGAP